MTRLARNAWKKITKATVGEWMVIFILPAALLMAITSVWISGTFAQSLAEEEWLFIAMGGAQMLMYAWFCFRVDTVGIIRLLVPTHILDWMALGLIPATLIASTITRIIVGPVNGGHWLFHSIATTIALAYATPLLISFLLKNESAQDD